MLREIIKETKELTKEDFIKEMIISFKKHFPKGYISFKDKGYLSEDVISCVFGIIGDGKYPNGIAENDPTRHSFIMFRNGDNSYSFKASRSWYYTFPEKGSFNAMGRVKTKLGNNSKITLEKAKIKLDKFFKKYSKMLEDDKDNIYHSKDFNISKYFVFK